ncbi:uncharacterized protein NECHADRAFT_85559 [Fusarium vanettenii 77-13-4]|uniref:Uncharacterized protein n=1 Tax=Fusarium vanettenii (strain ATCC MYA-4622 / CBS 123669 / FGSC 9596 / NRRL 45880 / 77-13-4) TaxID=660122 RepID=C7ZNV9_FUSV7|nr:uncharacterized protein NECHADRAFT_85559 [Fusarium vanettenii 77-13-4]EEU34070.1 hypothetical protein NECHADRAFT_85559 [Fusarium vanettenii 77-13-4]
MEFFKAMFQSCTTRTRAPHKSPSGKEWQLQFWLSSDPENLLSDSLGDKPEDWTAHLDLVTSDLPSLMHDGLYLTQENVQVLENYVHKDYSEERKRYFLRRYFTIVDPNWSGKLSVASWNYEAVRDFRIQHLSADKVHNAKVSNSDGNTVYYYDMSNPEKNANYIYDDMPMRGLWPFPRKEEGVKDSEVSKREGEDGDQEEEEERKETEEGEEVLKDEGGINEGEETKWEEEEPDSFSAWEEEGLNGFSDSEYGDSMIDAWWD